jgi:peptidyl-prolyl cis-trans isomerase SurA
MLKKILYLSMPCFLMIPVIAGAQTPASPPPPLTQPVRLNAEPVTPLNRIVVIINDEVVSQSDLDQAIDEMKQQAAASKIEIAPEKLREDALQQLINYRLLMQMATRNDIKASDSEIDQTLEQIANSNHLTVEQLKSQLALQHTSYEDFRHKIGQQLIITKVQQQLVAGQIKVTDQDIADFKSKPQGPREYKIADFFVPVSERPSAKELDQALTNAHNIQQQLNNGTSIDSVNFPYQDLGWRTAKDLPQIFADQLSGLTLTNASPPLRAPNGYHVLKLIETRTSTQNLTDDQIRQLIFAQKFTTAVKAAIEKARKEAYIQIIPQ